MPDSSSPSNTAASTAPIAVVIPYYNGSPFIERALRSVYAQSMPPAEVVIVNDGSRDEEREFLHRLQPQYGFKLIDQANGGQGAARNAGVAAASAPYICFLDQDDFWLEHHNRILMAAIPPDDSRFGYVYGDLWEADGEGRITRHNLVQVTLSGQHPKDSLFDLLRNDMFVLPSASLIKRAVFQAVGGFDTQFIGYEDDDLFLRIYCAGYTHYFIEQAVSVWCIHTTSTSYTMLMHWSRFRYFKKLVAAFPDAPLRGQFYLRDCLVPRFGYIFMGHAIQTHISGSEDEPEMRAILDEYAAIVRANPSIGRRDRLKLRIVLTLVHDCPRWLLPRITGVLIRLPKMAWLRQSFWQR